ncbi:hypothetical protein H4582DRAFT_1509335 [Lactarius indigo]|nr:hypothetical protein H4582DRAFT_1509335 [Lactarius indigo]
MPALIPVDNTLGALLIGTVLSSILYGVTWLQVYYYYNSHCSRDRWPLKSFVAFLMLVDTVNLVFVVHEPYRDIITNFGDYESSALRQLSWGQSAITLSTNVLEVSVQHFYAYRIYRLGRGSPYLPAAISVVSLTEVGEFLRSGVPRDFHLVLTDFGKVLGSCTVQKCQPSFRVFFPLFFSRVFQNSLKHIHDSSSRFEEFLIPTLSCKVLCDILITVGMVYYLLSKRTQVRRTNNVLNLLAIYSINCGTLHLVFAISCVTVLAKYRDTLIYVPSLFIMIRLSLCAFMSILNSRDTLRETLDAREDIIVMVTSRGPTVPCDTQNTTEASTNTAVSEGVPLPNFSDTSFPDSVIAFNREKYPGSSIDGMSGQIYKNH